MIKRHQKFKDIAYNMKMKAQVHNLLSGTADNYKKWVLDQKRAIDLLHPDQLVSYHELFELYDADRSGGLSMPEIVAGSRALGMSAQKTHHVANMWWKVFRHGDQNGYYDDAEKKDTSPSVPPEGEKPKDTLSFHHFKMLMVADDFILKM